MTETLPRGPIRGIIFDLDGTLIDSFGAITDSYRFAVGQLGIDPLPLGVFRQKIGMPIEEFFAETIAPGAVADAVRLFREQYVKIYLEKTTLMTEAAAVTEELHRRGKVLGVVTNKLGVFARNLVAHLGVGKYFAVVYGDRDGMAPKPSGEMVVRAMDIMGVRPEESVYVGDTPLDVDTGTNAGISTICVATGFFSVEELKTTSARAVIPRLRGLLEMD